MGRILDPYPTEDINLAIDMEDNMEDEWESWDSIHVTLYEDEDQDELEELWITEEEEQHINEILGRGGGPYQTTWIEEDALEEIVVEGSRYGKKEMSRMKQAWSEIRMRIPEEATLTSRLS